MIENAEKRSYATAFAAARPAIRLEKSIAAQERAFERAIAPPPPKPATE
jgi:hypothetical protein